MIEIELDEDAIAAVAQEALEEHVRSGEMEYECPECGKPIKITGLSNECKCGFVLNVEIGDIQL
ncbi:C2H2-type zinc finger protein [Eggerthella sinensis]|uniref:C2H2-type zinc finger protein n=1 Tax=Eggerthella sinensis TaxID=242230 RepID=UPI00266B5006|nr:hypothetical protein [Eggerthella sinensis]